jgi:hypothetical protein
MPPASPAAGAAAPSPPLDLDDVILAWSELLPGFSPATRAAVQQAQPLRLEGDVIVFGVPPALLEAARPRFKKEADTIRAALAERLGHSLKFNLVAAKQFDTAGGTDRARPAPPAAGPAPVGEPVEDEADVVIDATEAPPRPPEARFADEFGATVIDEVPRQ